MLAILWLLRSRGRMTAPQLAEALETSVRTIYRYIDALCASGVPILSEPGQAGGYSLLPSFRSAPLFFEPAELVAIFQAAVFARQAGYPRLDTLETALAKIRQNLSPEQEGVVERHEPALGVAPGYGGEAIAAWGKELEEAAATTRTVALRYRKPGAAASEQRQIDPYGLAFRDGHWYVIGRCHQRQEVREFRLDRIEAVTPTDQPFVYPAGFQINEYLAENWVVRQVRTGPITRIRLQGTPAVLADLAEHWYVRHCVLERTDESLLIGMDQTGLPHFRDFLLSCGQRIRVLEPERLRLELAEMALGLMKHHHPSEP